MRSETAASHLWRPIHLVGQSSLSENLSSFQPTENKDRTKARARLAQRTRFAPISKNSLDCSTHRYTRARQPNAYTTRLTLLEPSCCSSYKYAWQTPQTHWRITYIQ
ncbi:unnamed protein product [Ectocarpus sp. 4 AP-2014]